MCCGFGCVLVWFVLKWLLVQLGCCIYSGLWVVLVVLLYLFSGLGLLVWTFEFCWVVGCKCFCVFALVYMCCIYCGVAIVRLVLAVVICLVFGFVRG